MKPTVVCEFGCTGANVAPQTFRSLVPRDDFNVFSMGNAPVVLASAAAAIAP